MADPAPCRHPLPHHRHQPHSLQLEEPFQVHHQASPGFPGEHAVESGVAGSSSAVVSDDLGVLPFHHLAVLHVLAVIFGLAVCQGLSEIGDRFLDLHAAEVAARALEAELAGSALVSLEPENLPLSILACE